MKLYNKTKCPDKLLKPLLTLAGKSVGARTSGVVVKVTQGRGYYSRATAKKCNYVYSWHLKGRRTGEERKQRKRGRLIKTDGGYFFIALPAKCEKFTGIGGTDRARAFYDTAQHEWGHIRDYQSGCYTPSPRTPSGRRIQWRDRPAEIRADNYVADAKRPPVASDLIIDLGEYLNGLTS